MPPLSLLHTKKNGVRERLTLITVARHAAHAQLTRFSAIARGVRAPRVRRSAAMLMRMLCCCCCVRARWAHVIFSAVFRYANIPRAPRARHDDLAQPRCLFPPLITTLIIDIFRSYALMIRLRRQPCLQPLRRIY